jgi:hypothetical protein
MVFFEYGREMKALKQGWAALDEILMVRLLLPATTIPRKRM